jgi:hypothetical protein
MLVDQAVYLITTFPAETCTLVIVLVGGYMARIIGALDDLGDLGGSR